MKYAARRAADPEAYRVGHRFAIIKHRYRIDREKWTEIYERQDGKCPICAVAIDIYSAVDHDHSCCPAGESCGACVRGILCRPCNLGLGSFADDTSRLLNAIRYLGGE